MRSPTARERVVHDAVCSNGKSIAETAAKYGISTSTVRRYMDKVTEYIPPQPSARRLAMELNKVTFYLHSLATDNGAHNTVPSDCKDTIRKVLKGAQELLGASR